MTDLARLRQLVATTAAASDADLLDRFVADRDGPAFAALVHRHGPMVLAVCRRVLRHRQDAEDAFQATFLVLARRAETIKPQSLLGNWLYGVAYRTALGARRVTAARRVREARAAALRTGEELPDDGLAAELREALDRELAALPDAYRAAVVACDLEGLHRRDAAVRLGWTEGTLSSRLARARALLTRRLARYGLVVPAAGLAAIVAPAAVAGELLEPTIRFGKLVAVGEAAVAAPVAALMEGTMKTMFLAKFKALAAAVVVGCAVSVTAVAGWRAEEGGTADPTPQEPGKVAEAPKPTAPKAEKQPRVARNADKERIAELEREREILLAELAKLHDRLAKLEAVAKEADAKRMAEEQLKAHLVIEQERLRSIAEQLRTPRTPPTPPVAPVPPAPPTPPRGNSALPPPAVKPPVTSPPAPPVPDVTLPPLALPNREGAIAPPRPEPAPKPPLAPLPPLVLPQPEPINSAQPEPVPTPNSSANQPNRTGGTQAKVKAVVRVYSVSELASDDKEGDALVKVLRAVVEPKSWGADAGVEYLPGRKVLVVRQTAEAHDQVSELLVLLRGQKTPAKK
ncbi:RNA polymerase sigma factor [Frigoriglobus tundricola]|uniref:RNA polymerase sigma-70 region 2 domain-containing protein n=1 Tax=Frigoriglobus tundricola TaxID=2774151 RepID=A0A6M5YH07_9BACT|nr:RNA polymerase sigma factor [Frigoriglobus tundricola]QJW93339.1 hypothetical protein FTUN_0845 [Frigoriglobus tundricola]